MLKRQTCKDLIGSDELFVNQSLEEEGVKEEELKIMEDDNKDNKEVEDKSKDETDSTVLCRNTHCLGSLLQSWVVESYLEVVIVF